MAEAAVVLPVLLTVTGGMIQVVQWGAWKLAADAAAQAGAGVLAQGGSAWAAQAEAVHQLGAPATMHPTVAVQIGPDRATVDVQAVVGGWMGHWPVEAVRTAVLPTAVPPPASPAPPPPAPVPGRYWPAPVPQRGFIP
ncbi:MAG: hypothetical protein K6V97_07610 [Actinomycetia bacterium]|nr:hypothetical protein [Actinomycetes bacterium]